MKTKGCTLYLCTSSQNKTLFTRNCSGSCLIARYCIKLAQVRLSCSARRNKMASRLFVIQLSSPTCNNATVKDILWNIINIYPSSSCWRDTWSSTFLSHRHVSLFKLRCLQEHGQPFLFQSCPHILLCLSEDSWGWSWGKSLSIYSTPSTHNLCNKIENTIVAIITVHQTSCRKTDLFKLTSNSL